MQTDEISTKIISKKTTNEFNTKKEDNPVTDWDALQAAVDNARSATSDQTILLEEGNYTNTDTVVWGNPYIVLTIDGNGQTIDGNQKQAFNIRSGCSLILKNMKITNSGNSAIRNNDAFLTISNVTFTNNGGQGGAICNNVGTVTITNSTFTNNAAAFGGGAIFNNGTLTISDSTFTNNTGGEAGAIYNLASLTISNSTFQDNQAGDRGGAIYDESEGIWTNISSCNFINNTAYYQAAIFAYGWVNLTGNTFKGNTAFNEETIDLKGYPNGIFEGNRDESTDIALREIKISTIGDPDSFNIGDEVVLNLSVIPYKTDNYKDLSEGINDLKLYFNDELVSTKYENYTTEPLDVGPYEAYFTTCNKQSNILTFRVLLPDSEITVTPNNTKTDNKTVHNNVKTTGTSKDKSTSNVKKISQTTTKTFSIKRSNDTSVLYQGDNIVTLDELNKIFNTTFDSGRLVLYINGEVVFNDTVNDDLASEIFEIIEKYLGESNVNVEFTDNNNDTNSFEENVIIE